MNYYMSFKKTTGPALSVSCGGCQLPGEGAYFAVQPPSTGNVTPVM